MEIDSKTELIFYRFLQMNLTEDLRKIQKYLHMMEYL